MFQNFAGCPRLLASQLSYHVTSRACSLETSFGCMEIHLSTFMMIQNLVSNLYKNPCNSAYITCLQPLHVPLIYQNPRGKSLIQVNELSNYLDDKTKIQPCAILNLMKYVIFIQTKKYFFCM